MDIISNITGSIPTHKVSVKSLTYLYPGSPPAFSYQDVPLPVKPNQVWVKVKCATLSHTDIKSALNPVMWAIPGEKGLGRDYSGIVEECGNEIKNLKIGDRVCGFSTSIANKGTIRSHVVISVPSDAIFKIPENLSFEQGAAFPSAFATAYQCIEQVKIIKQNSPLCILGGSTAIGLYAIQLAKEVLGIQNIVVTCPEVSTNLVKNLGATIVVNSGSEPNVPETLRNILEREIGHNQKFHIILDCEGGTDVLMHYKELLEPRSMGSFYVTTEGDQKIYGCGTDSSTTSAILNPRMLTRRIFGQFWGLNYSVINASTKGNWKERVNELFVSGKVKAVIDSTYEWNKWPTAWEKQTSNSLSGSLVLKIEDF